jgi:hypothetical protein
MGSSAGEDYDRTLSSRNAHQRKGSVFSNTVTTVQHSTNTANTVQRWKHQTPETGKADVWLSIYGFVSVSAGPWSLRLPNPTKQRQIIDKSTNTNGPKYPTIFALIHAKQRNKTPINARRALPKPLQVSSIVGYYERTRIDCIAL